MGHQLLCEEVHTHTVGRLETDMNSKERTGYSNLAESSSNETSTVVRRRTHTVEQNCNR